LLSLGKSPRTVTEYARDVRLWSEWFRRPVDYFREPEWDDYVIHLRQSGKKGSTIKRYCIALRRFFKYLRRRKIVTHDPSRDSEAVKVDKTLPSWLTEQEVDLVLSKARILREQAILEVLYDCGLRNEELRTLRLEHVQGHLLQITGKGSKQRIVAMPPRAVEYLTAWLKERPAGTDLVFPSKHGKVMTGKTLRRLTERLVARAGITKPVTPHTFRHSIATHLAMRGVHVERIQLFLGHESPETTMRYIHLAQSLVQEDVLKAHPRGDVNRSEHSPSNAKSQSE
jgi:site-specific recombinase XerD